MFSWFPIEFIAFFDILFAETELFLRSQDKVGSEDKEDIKRLTFRMMVNQGRFLLRLRKKKPHSLRSAAIIILNNHQFQKKPSHSRIVTKVK